MAGGQGLKAVACITLCLIALFSASPLVESSLSKASVARLTEANNFLQTAQYVSAQFEPVREVPGLAVSADASFSTTPRCHVLEGSATTSYYLGINLSSNAVMHKNSDKAGCDMTTAHVLPHTLNGGNLSGVTSVAHSPEAETRLAVWTPLCKFVPGPDARQGSASVTHFCLILWALLAMAITVMSIRVLPAEGCVCQKMRSEYEYLAYLRLEETPPSRPHQEEIQAGADLLAYPLFPFGLASDWRPSAKDKKKSNNYSKLITGKAKSATAHVDLTADCASSSSAAQQDDSGLQQKHPLLTQDKPWVKLVKRAPGPQKSTAPLATPSASALLYGTAPGLLRERGATDYSLQVGSGAKADMGQGAAASISPGLCEIGLDAQGLHCQPCGKPRAVAIIRSMLRSGKNNNKLKGTVATELSGSKQKAAKQKTSKKGFGLGRLCCCSQSTVLH